MEIAITYAIANLAVFGLFFYVTYQMTKSKNGKKDLYFGAPKRQTRLASKILASRFPLLEITFPIPV